MGTEEGYAIYDPTKGPRYIHLDPRDAYNVYNSHRPYTFYLAVVADPTDEEWTEFSSFKEMYPHIHRNGAQIRVVRRKYNLCALEETLTKAGEWVWTLSDRPDPDPLTGEEFEEVSKKYDPVN